MRAGAHADRGVDARESDVVFGPPDNRITPADRARAYEILGFVWPEGKRSAPDSLELSVLGDAVRLRQLHEKGQDEQRHRLGGGTLRGLTEFRVGVALADERSLLTLTEIKRGRPNHGGREMDRTRTIIGTIHTHPWDAAQSIGDVRNLIRSNDVLGGVVTPAGRVSLLIKPPDLPEGDRSPFATEAALQGASLREAPRMFRILGLTGAMSAAFDLPIGTSRDPYIQVVCDRLGLLCYIGHVEGQTLRRA
jgi:hypothetical protein